MQEFRLNRRYLVIMSICLVIFLLFLAMGLALPFLPSEPMDNSDRMLGLSVISTLFFGCCALMTGSMLRKLPRADVVADNEGIWYRHLGREKGLVPWQSIDRIKERPWLQRLDVEDVNSNLRLEVVYFLDGFETLRELLARNSLSALHGKTMKGSSPGYTKGFFYHLLYLGSIFLLLSITLMTLKTLTASSHSLTTFGLMVFITGAVIYQYMNTAIGIVMSDNALVLAYPARKQRILFANIREIQLTDTFYRGERLPEVHVFTLESTKPLKLRKLGVDAHVLFAVLNQMIK